VVHFSPGIWYTFQNVYTLNTKYLFNKISNEQRQNGFIRIEYPAADLRKIIVIKEIVITVEDKVSQAQLE
jgi:hypothetical protein